MEKQMSLVFITGKDDENRKGHLTYKGLTDRILKAEAILRLVFEKDLADRYFDIEVKCASS